METAVTMLVQTKLFHQHICLQERLQHIIVVILTDSISLPNLWMTVQNRLVQFWPALR